MVKTAFYFFHPNQLFKSEKHRETLQGLGLKVTLLGKLVAPIFRQVLSLLTSHKPF